MAGSLFVYGTLHPDRAAPEIADVVRSLISIGSGTVRGELYHFGEYPGVVLNPASKETIQGEIFALPSDPAALARLDAYEEYRPEDPGGSLFKRRRATVTLANGLRRQCWVYVYNQPIPAAVPSQLGIPTRLSA